jgi:predicted acyltransferase
VLAGVSGRLLAIKFEAGGKMVSIQAWLYGNLFSPLASPKNASLLGAITYVLLLYLVAWGMYRKKWFVKF